MKQLYYTLCDTGKGSGGVPWAEAGPQFGFHIRAASAGIESFRQNAAVGYAGYALPAGMNSDSAAAAPVRLALLSTSEAGRLLCHDTWLGHHAASGRNDNYFAHVLLDVPPTLDAHHAIQTWHSPLWQREDDGGGTELPEMLFLPVADKLNDAALTKFLDHPAHREWLTFLLTALLAAPPRRRIFLAAPTEDVAMCIYGITRALPATMLEDFTFSTYEREPLACTARVIGASWGDAAGMDLHDACYSELQAAYNTYSGRKSDLAPAPFAEFAVEALATGKTAGLDEFRNTWQRLGVKDSGQLDLIYRMARGTGTLTKEESQQALQNAALAAWIATRNDALQQFLEWALDDTVYATTAFSRVVVALRQKPDSLAKLALTVQEQGLAALKAGDRVRTTNALEGILPMVAPAKASAVWDEVLAKVTDPDALTWEVRWYLLPKFAKLRQLPAGQPIDPVLAKWFRVPAVQLSPLLGLDLPLTYQMAACLGCLTREGEASPILAQALAAHTPLVLPLIQQVVAEPKGEARAGQLFDTILAEAPQHPWVEELVRDGRSLPATLLDRCLETALNAGKLDAEHLVRNHGSVLLELLAGKRSLDRIASLFLSQPPADLITDRGLVTFLEKLAADSGLSPEVKARLDAVLTLESYLRKPSLDVDTLTKTAAALALQPPLVPLAARPRLLEKVAAEIANKSGAADVQTDLENVLLHLGPQSEGGPTTLYRELLKMQPDAKLFGRQIDLAHAFMAVALGAVQSLELAQQVDNLEGDAYGLAVQLARRGRKKALTKLEEKTTNWPKNARTQWTFLVKAVQPRGLQGLARDAILLLVGVAVGALVMVILKMSGVWN